mmetsp:Transcript_29013/g.78132  ORF Transcript_29013/g.78132 Transcript_29013/m.78132 type:complete len:225 (-) Transcript_29013:3639-4313(-)
MLPLSLPLVILANSTPEIRGCSPRSTPGTPSTRAASYFSCCALSLASGSVKRCTDSTGTSSLHIGHRLSACSILMNCWRVHAKWQHGHSPQSSSNTRLPVATSTGMMFWQLKHCSSVSGPAMLQNTQGTMGSSTSSASLSGFRTMSSIFFLYFTATWSLYSGRMSMAAYSKADFFRPARLHSMIVDVRMGTMCLGNLEMFLATRTSMRAAVVWSLMATRLLTRV